MTVVTFQQAMWRPKLMMIFRPPAIDYARNQINRREVTERSVDNATEDVLQRCRIFAAGRDCPRNKAIVSVEVYHLL